jgi:hypothetical protein
MPPDKESGPPLTKAARDIKAPAGRSTHPTIPPGAASGRECAWCHGPLPKGRRRFCSDLHRIRGQKAERRYDDADYADGVRRLVTAQGKRAGADLGMFVLFAGSVDYARARLQDAADQLIAQGYSYGDIGRALGITRQGARQRFGRQQAVVGEPPESGAAG